MTIPRRLVVNADDFGLTAGVNDGIFDAHALGILTSASLIANAPATADAIRRARSFPSLGIGAHLALVDGLPLVPPRKVPTLVAHDGRFRQSWKPFIVACLRGRVSFVEVERELAAQIEHLRGAGVKLTHLDSHKHVHAYPPIFDIVVRLAARFGIPVVRVPYERWSRRSLVGEAGGERRTARRQSLLNAVMFPWAVRNHRTARLFALRAPRFIGRVHTGVLNGPTLHEMLRATSSGVTELMVHPGYLDEALAQTGTRLLESRQKELALLCSLETRALVVGQGIDLVRHDLAHAMRGSFRHVS